MLRREYEKKRGRKGYKRQKIYSLLASHIPHPKLRIWFYRKMGVKIGEKAYIGINSYVDDLFPELIEIADEVGIGMHSIIVSFDDATGTVKPIKIGKRAYIGAGTIILPGAVIGEGAVIGAGSVVKGEIPPYMLAAGAPIRVIRKADPEKYIWLKGHDAVYNT